MLGPVLGEQGWFLWGAALVIGFPLAVVLLGEVAHRLRRRGSAMAQPVGFVRNVVLPALVVFFFIRFVLERGASEIDVKVSSTLMWLLVLATVLSLVTSLLFGSAAGKETWRGRAPRLFIDIIRFGLIVIGGAIIVGTVWGADLGGLFAAFGVGGIVIGLALQDTLASLLGGLALLSEKPFTVGDWVDIDGVEGKVTDVNWRTVRLQNREEDLIVVPNIVFGTQLIINNSRPERHHVEVIPLGFSYDDPPTKVHDVLLDVARTTPGVLDKPQAKIRTMGFNDSSVDYEARLCMPDYDSMPDIRSLFLSRVWYAAQREGLTIPFPIRTVHHHDATDMTARDAAAQVDLRDRVLDDGGASHQLLAPLISGAPTRHFAQGDFLLVEDATSDGLGLLLSGQAMGSVRDPKGVEHDVIGIGSGEFYGERATFRGFGNRMTVRAVTDVEVVMIATSDVVGLAQRNQRFSTEIEQVLQTRRSAVDRVLHSAVETEAARVSGNDSIVTP